MQSRGILLLVMLWSGVSSFIASAQQNVSVAWERRVTNFNFATFLPDNLGHLALVGTRDGFVTALLLDTNGLLVSALPSCSRAPIDGVIATSDSTGRIFASAPELSYPENNQNVVHCARFEPLLGSSTNFADVFIGWFNFAMRGLVPDETGGVFASIESRFVNETYVSLLGFAPDKSQYLNGVFHGSSYPGVRGGGIYSIGTNGFYMVADTTSAQVSRHSRNGELVWRQQFGTYMYYKGGLKAAAADSEGNLVFIAGYRTAIDGPWAAEIVKLDPEGNILWSRQRSGPRWGYAPPPYGMAASQNGEFLLWGDGTLVKFSASGQELWTSTNSVPSRFTSAGHILQWQQNGNDVVITKLDSSGTILWRNSHADAGAVGFMLGPNDELYVAVLLRDGETAIFKYVENRPTETVKHETIEAAQPHNCPIPQPPLPPRPDPIVTTTRLRLGKIAVCWPTNYCDYMLQAARHLNKRDPNRTRWVSVETAIVTNETSCCTTSRVARYGRNYRIIPPQ